MSQTRKTFFAATVDPAAATAILLNTLMAANGWAETDSHEGVQCMVKPSAETVYLGYDENVRDAAGVGVYQGFPLEVGETVNIAEYFAGGLVDPNNIWFYTAAGEVFGVIFKGL